MESNSSFSKLWQDVKTHRRLYYKVLPLTFVAAAIITLSIPNYYNCTVKLAPEIPGNKSGGSLASLASSFGVNLGSPNAQGGDAILPNLYPDLMNSVVFKASLFPIRIQQEDADTTTTYYDYLLNDQRAPWWSEILSGTFKAIKSLFADSEDNNAGKVDPHKLTKEQFKIVEAISHKVVCDVDKKTFVITIDVTVQDPVVAATIADSVQNRLQKFITDYRTRKARIDLDYNRKLLVEAEARYDKARQDYSAYSDAYRKSIFEDKNAVRQKLDNKLQIESRAYSQVATQVQVAEAKVQEETPAFTLLQPATVPVKKSGPKRAQTCLIFLFPAAIVTTLYIFHKEGDLLTLLGDDDEDDLDTPSLILNDSEYILVPKSSLKTPATE
jgi:hypothetical protein